MKKIQEELTLKVVELLEMKPPAKVLDLGCGVGFSTNLLREMGFEVIGIDINPLMLEKAKVKGLNVFLGDFRELEKHFKEKSFDYVVSVSALQWVKNWNDMKRVAEGVYYVLKDNGKVGIQFYPFSEVELNMFCKAFRRVGFNCKAIIESFSSQKRVVFIVLHKLKGAINIMLRVRYGGNVQAYKLSRRVKIDKETIKNITNSLAEELAKRMYYKLLLLKFLPEIKAVEKRKLKAIKGKEIEKFLDRLSNSE